MCNATPVLTFKTRRPTSHHYFLRVNFRTFSFFTRTMRAKINPGHVFFILESMVTCSHTDKNWQNSFIRSFIPPKVSNSMHMKTDTLRDSKAEKSAHVTILNTIMRKEMLLLCCRKLIQHRPWIHLTLMIVWLWEELNVLPNQLVIKSRLRMKQAVRRDLCQLKDCDSEVIGQTPDLMHDLKEKELSQVWLSSYCHPFLGS